MKNQFYLLVVVVILFSSFAEKIDAGKIIGQWSFYQNSALVEGKEQNCDCKYGSVLTMESDGTFFIDYQDDTVVHVFEDGNWKFVAPNEISFVNIKYNHAPGVIANHTDLIISLNDSMLVLNSNVCCGKIPGKSVYKKVTVRPVTKISNDRFKEK